MITLSNDQEEAISKLRKSMSQNKRILFRGETGFGKSIISTYMIARALEKDHIAIFNIPRKELLRQMADTFRQFNIPFSYIASGKPFNPYAKAYLSTTGTLVNNMDKVAATIIFKDESHHGSTQLDRINEHFTKKGAWIVGLTATPDNENLGRWYDDMVEGPNIKQLIEMKRLSDFRYFAPTEIDRTVFKTVGGEFQKGQVDEYMREKAVIVGSAIEYYKKYAQGKMGIAFCSSIKHSKMTAEKFRDAGITAVHMDGDTPEDERKRIAKALATKEIKMVMNVELLTFGYDIASASGIKNANIEIGFDFNPTKSLKKQRQKNGRWMRYKNYPALCFDHVSNYKDHGMPDDEIQWSLTSKPINNTKTNKSEPRGIRCDTDSNGAGCFYFYSSGDSCPNCGKEREIKSREIKEVAGELSELSRDQEIKNRKTEQRQARTLEELIELGKKRNMRYPAKWAARVMSARIQKR